MVEFALIAPIAFLLLMSIIVVGIFVTNYIQLTNVARDGARVAAICGAGNSVTAAQMPNGGGSCSDVLLQSYITNQLVTIPAGSVSPLIFVCAAASAGTCSSSAIANGFEGCYGQSGRIIEVDMYYDQPLYLPLVSTLFQNESNGMRRLYASAQATCE